MIIHSGWNEGNQLIGACFHLFLGWKLLEMPIFTSFMHWPFMIWGLTIPTTPEVVAPPQNSHTYTSNESNDSSDLIQKDMWSLRASGSDKLGEILKIREIGDCFVHHSVSERCAKGAVSGVMHWISLQRCSDDRFSRSVKGRISLQTKKL